jgi:hypothetical protein
MKDPAPSRSTDMQRRQSWSLIDRGSPNTLMPALFTNMSGGPCSATTRATIAATLAASATSVSTKRALAGNSATISSATRRPSAALISAMTTLAPSGREAARYRLADARASDDGQLSLKSAHFVRPSRKDIARIIGAFNGPTGREPPHAPRLCQRADDLLDFFSWPEAKTQ